MCSSVTATDQDAGDNGEIEFVMANSSNPYFSITTKNITTGGLVQYVGVIEVKA